MSGGKCPGGTCPGGLSIVIHFMSGINDTTQSRSVCLLM